ncbi:MAG TPA: hypothetical protein VLY82_00110 [Nitrososphaerales archaeon]|nr:hypothetical protein [Nitrososphaerales archaeon]
MRLRTKVIVISLVIIIGVVLVLVPFITGPSTVCNSNLLCIPDQRQSVTRHFIGFGGESSYGVWPQSEFYYFCIIDGACSQWFGPVPH